MNMFKKSLFLLNFNNETSLFVRFAHTKHWHPKWKVERKLKFIKIDFSKLTEDTSKLSKEEKRTRLKEKGIYPQKPWFEKPMYISSTSNIFEPYVPPEGDGKFSAISTSGLKQNLQLFGKKTASYQAIKKIRKYEEEFDKNEFANQALDIYTQAHKALVNQDKTTLSQYVTEKLFPEMLYNLENKTIVWKYIKSLEPARVVHARCTSLMSKDNLFAQITVRLHSEQILAIYDRFGRLMNGSTILSKDVLEYIVLEKHLSNEYGTWRLHSKIIPPWMTAHQPIAKTFVINNNEPPKLT